jgi:lysozyme family protein
MIPNPTKEWIISNTVNTEAGYVNNPNDLGGETNHGIILTTAKEWEVDLRKVYNWDGKMINLTKEMALYIYDRGWWQKLKCNELYAISPLLAHRVFDFGINGGRTASVTYLQRLLNVLNRQGKDYQDLAVDGIIGNGTLGQLQAFVNKRKEKGLCYLLTGLTGMHVAHYVNISESRGANEEFTNGWLERLLSSSIYYAKVLDFDKK